MRCYLPHGEFPFPCGAQEAVPNEFERRRPVIRNTLAWWLTWMQVGAGHEEDFSYKLLRSGTTISSIIFTVVLLY